MQTIYRHEVFFLSSGWSYRSVLLVNKMLTSLFKKGQIPTVAFLGYFQVIFFLILIKSTLELGRYKISPFRRYFQVTFFLLGHKSNVELTGNKISHFRRYFQVTFLLLGKKSNLELPGYFFSPIYKKVPWNFEGIKYRRFEGTSKLLFFSAVYGEWRAVNINRLIFGKATNLRY